MSSFVDFQDHVKKELIWLIASIIYIRKLYHLWCRFIYQIVWNELLVFYNVNFPLMLLTFCLSLWCLTKKDHFSFSKLHRILCTDDPIAKRDLAPNIDSNSKPSAVIGDNQQSNLKVHACMCESSLWKFQVIENSIISKICFAGVTGSGESNNRIGQTTGDSTFWGSFSKFCWRSQW